MRILSHYFIARFLGLFATALLAALILLATVELVLNLDDLSSASSTPSASSTSSSSAMSSAVSPRSGAADSTSGVVHSLWVRLASYYLSDLLPIASFAAAFMAVAWAGRSMELVAIQAAGIRLSRVVIPILGAAFILSLASAILHETVILHADQTWNHQIRGRRDGFDFGRQAFWVHKGRMITNITNADAATRTLFGVEIFERGSDGTISRVIRAGRVRIDADGLWQIESAQIWTFDPERPADPPTLSENVTIALDLDTTPDEALLGAEPSLLSLPSLAHYLRVYERTSSGNHRRLVNLFHERLSQPWLVLLFAFLALPFGLRVDQKGRFVRSALGAAGVLGLFFLLRSVGVTMAQQEFFPVGLSPWLWMGVFALFTTFSLRRTGF